MIQRASEGGVPLESTFVSVYEPYAETPPLKAMRRLEIKRSDGNQAAKSHVALELEHGGGTDIFIALDPDQDAGLALSAGPLSTAAQCCLARIDANGKEVARVEK